MLHSNNFSLKSEREKRNLLAQIERANFVKNDWQMMKNLYKNLEVNPDADLLVALIDKFDKATPKDLKGEFPSAKTMAYMKRRVVRFLKKLAEENVELFLKISKELFLLQTSKIDFDWQWITTKLLFGNSKRWEQKRHGRGKFFIKNNIPNIYRKEAIGLAAWNEFPSIAYVILDAPNLATEVYEFAVKLLLSNKRNIPAFSQKQIEIFFESDSVWLQKIAANQYYELIIKGASTKPELLAKTYFFGNSKQQIRIKELFNEKINTQKKESTFKKMIDFLTYKFERNSIVVNFINTLAETAFASLEAKGHFSKRIERTLELVKRHSNILYEGTVFPFANILLKTQKPDLENLVYQSYLKAHIENAADWLAKLSFSGEAQRQRIFQIFEQKWESLRDAKKQTLVHQWLENPSFQVADFGWHVLSEYSSRRDVANQFFQLHFSRWNRPNLVSLKNMANAEKGGDTFWECCGDRLKNNYWDGKLLISLINESKGKLERGLIQILIKKARTQIFEWLPQIAQLENRDEIIKNILLKIPKTGHISPNIFKFLTSKNYWFLTVSWQVFIEKYNSTNLIQQVVWQVAYRSQDEWSNFLNRLFKTENEVFKSNVLTVFSNLIKQQPAFVKKIASVFRDIAQSFDNQTIIQILQLVNGDAWSEIKPTILTYLKEEKGHDLWIEILRNLNKLSAPNPNETRQNDTLSQRILADKHLRNTLLKVTRTEVLECHHPPLEDLLLSWATEHGNLFESNSPELFSACTHRLSKIRNWGIQTAQKNTLDAIFALQLLESGVPDAVKLGQQYFEEVRVGSSDELEAVLALIDSPNDATRTFGRSYFQERKEGLESDLVLENLTEHTDPLVQEFVAKKLNENKKSSKNRQIRNKKYFDRAVLRTKNKARKAKELVKNRLEKDLQFQPKILLELARGQNKKDQEWAIEQLAKLALMGEEVEGFELV